MAQLQSGMVILTYIKFFFHTKVTDFRCAFRFRKRRKNVLYLPAVYKLFGYQITFIHVGGAVCTYKRPVPEKSSLSASD